MLILVLFSHMVEMANYDIGPCGVQGKLIIVLFSQTVEMVELAYWSLRCTGHVNILSY